MGFSITSPDQIIKIEVVRRGCEKIQNGVDKFAKTVQTLELASELLGHNSLVFGDINSTLDKQLDLLGDDVRACWNKCDGLADGILAQAEAQYKSEWAEYNAYLAWRASQQQKQDGLMASKGLN